MAKVKELTPEQKKAYMDSGGSNCPVCGSDQISGDLLEVDSGSAWQPMGCQECDAYWNDVYNLVDIERKG